MSTDIMIVLGTLVGAITYLLLLLLLLFFSTFSFCYSLSIVDQQQQQHSRKKRKGKKIWNKNPLMWKYIWRRNGRGGSCWWWWAMAARPAGDFGRRGKSHTTFRTPVLRLLLLLLLSITDFRWYGIPFQWMKEKKKTFIPFLFLHLTSNQGKEKEGTASLGCRIGQVRYIMNMMDGFPPIYLAGTRMGATLEWEREKETRQSPAHAINACGQAQLFLSGY